MMNRRSTPIVVLCGGKGTRLGSLTNELPKTLVPLNGTPFLQRILQAYISKGCHRFVLCIGYCGQAIVEFVQQNAFDAEIAFSDAGENVGMLTRLHHGRRLLTEERFFVVYGDTLIDVDLAAMAAEHVRSGAAVTLTTAHVKSPFGLVTIESENWISSFTEKPLQPYYIGHMLMDSSVVDTVDPALLQLPDGDGLVRLIQQLIMQRKVKTFPYAGPQITYNTQSDLREAEKNMKAFYTYVERGLS